MLHDPFRHVSNPDAGEFAEDCTAFQRLKQWIDRRLSLRREVNMYWFFKARRYSQGYLLI